MRFLIGIITGTVLTLFIATAVDAPTQTTLARTANTFSELWQKLIDSTSDALFAPPVLAGSAATAPAPDQLALAETSTPHEDDAAASAPLRAAEPVTALAPPAELPPPPPVRMPVPAPARSAPTQAAPVQAAADPVPDSARVWTPFHSQMSAEGFATRLSRTLDHDFRVERQSAGAYQVVFDADSPAEREALLMAIAEITGQ